MMSSPPRGAVPTDQNQAPKDRWPVEHHLLGDHSSKRKSQHIADPDPRNCADVD